MCGCYHCIKDLTFYKTGDRKTIHGSLIEDSKYASLLYINLDMAFHWNANSVDTFDFNNYKLNHATISCINIMKLWYKTIQSWCQSHVLTLEDKVALIWCYLGKRRQTNISSDKCMKSNTYIEREVKHARLYVSIVTQPFELIDVIWF